MSNNEVQVPKTGDQAMSATTTHSARRLDGRVALVTGASRGIGAAPGSPGTRQPPQRNSH